MIITILRDGGIITKSELSLWIKDKFLEGFMDLDAILVDLAKKEVIKQISVKGISSELIILNNDPFMLRVPPVKLIDNPSNRGLPSQFVKTYKSEVKTYFQDYHPSEEDNLKIINILIDPEVYETLRLLRTAIVTRQELEKLRIRGVKDISGVLQLLLDRQMIKIFRDQNNNEYFALLTDFYIDIIFPKYILNVIKTVYEQKSKPNKALMEFLKSLEETYFSMKKQEKSKK